MLNYQWPVCRKVIACAALWVALATHEAVQADVVLDWNAVMLQAIRIDNSPPTLATRNLAILDLAMFDAVNSIERTSQPYQFLLDPPPGVEAEPAAVAAAYEVVVDLYPPLRANADELYASYLAAQPPTPGLTNSLRFGAEIGMLTLSMRSADGSATQVPYIPSDAPGQWRRTPPFFRPPVDPQWGYVTPFCLGDIERFVPPGSPALGSVQYAEDLNQVKALGAKVSSTRSADQSQIATFWSDFSYTATPPGHWLEIAAAIARSRGTTLGQNARLFALLTLAQADSAIICWEAKYRYNSWRPVTAIQRADEDGNPATEPDPAWSSFLSTPSFPEYTSGHSTFSKASATVLARFFGTDNLPFTIGSDAMPGVYRDYTSVAACADEIGMSRIYGGIHFMSANRDGKACGLAIANFVLDNFLLPVGAPPRLVAQSLQPQGMRLFLHGAEGQSFVIQASSDFSFWMPIATNLASRAGTPILDPAASDQPIRFYRAHGQ